MSDHGPIDPAYVEKMNRLAHAIDEFFNGKPGLARTVGFALLIFPFGEPPDQDRVNYISNADRADMLAAMHEFLARAEGRYVKGGEGAPQ